MRTNAELIVLADCAHCPLNGQAVFGYGNPDAELVVIGEAPGRNEIREGRPFIGPSGRLLDATLEDTGLDRSSVYTTNAVLCRPTDAEGHDTPPPKQALACCAPRLRAEIADVAPRIVVPMGATAATAITGQSGRLADMAGAMFRYDGRWAIPAYHPAAVLRGQHDFFDQIWDTFHKSKLLLDGSIPEPPPDGPRLNWLMYGHRGTKQPLTWHGKEHWTWSGYWEATDSEIATARRFLGRLADEADQGPMELGLDTESRVADFFEPLLMIQIGNQEWQAAFTWGVIQHLKEQFREVLQHPNITWDLWNTAYDRQVLKHRLGVDLGERDRDGMCYALGITEKANQTGLKYQSRMWRNAEYYERELEQYIDPNKKTDTDPWDRIPPDVMARYGCADVYHTHGLVAGGLLPGLCDEEGTRELAEGLLTDAQRLFADQAYEGVYVNMDYAASLEEKWVPIIRAAIEQVQDYAQSVGFPKDPAMVASQKSRVPCPDCVIWSSWYRTSDQMKDLFDLEPREWKEALRRTDFGDPSCKMCMKRRYVLISDNRINVKSSKQMQHLAFDVLHMRDGGWGRSVNKDFWEANEGHELTGLVAEYKQLDHLLRNYIRGIGDDVKRDEKVHPDFLVGGTVTGRPSVRNPPLQTLPKWGTDPELAKLIRRMFPAPPRLLDHDTANCPRCAIDDQIHQDWLNDSEYVIVDADYKNLELYVAWHYSHDDNLGRALNERDFHTATAGVVFNTPYENVTKAQRWDGKRVTFGVAYGRGAYALAMGQLKEITGGNPDKAQEYINRFWSMYPDYHRTYLQWQRDAMVEQELTSTTGRKRRWRLITQEMVKHVQNQAVNFPNQSLASDICIASAIRLNKSLRKLGWGRVMFTVHDSLVFLIKKIHVHEAISLIQQEMTKTDFPTHVTLRTDIEVGPNLGDIEPYDREKVYV